MTMTHSDFPGVTFGDRDVAVCFYKAGGVAGRLIRWQTRSEVGHTAVFLPRWAQWIEADVGKGDATLRHPQHRGRTGVVLRIGERRDRIAVAIVTLPFYEEAERFARETLGASYDKRQILRFLTRQKEANGSQDDYFCSEHSSLLLRIGGVRALAHSEPWRESPADLYRSPRLFPDA